MKSKLIKYGVLLGVHVPGVVIGTAISSPINGVLFRMDDFLSTMALVGIAMTIGIPVIFQFYSALVGTVIVFGLVMTVGSAIWYDWKPGIWSAVCVFAGSVMWSLGNVPSFCGLMSV